MDKTANLSLFHQCYHVFQPICTLPAQEKLGYESLIRSRDGLQPNQLFQQFSQRNQLPILDMWSIENAIQTFFSYREMQTGKERLFVNIFPSTVADDGFPDFVRKLSRNYEAFCQRVVFEISETLSDIGVWSNPQYIRRILKLREHGFLIALDDFGEGSTSIKKVVELAPDFIKLDMFFGKELSSNPSKQKLVRLFVEYCGGSNSELILEGIEREEDLEQAVYLGVPNGQGYLLGRPSAECIASGR
jgi:EAL domain-containing protein (putative c-di-GMP-specific phosphodiesterase class I)